MFVYVVLYDRDFKVFFTSTIVGESMLQLTNSYCSWQKKLPFIHYGLSSVCSGFWLPFKGIDAVIFNSVLQIILKC